MVWCGYSLSRTKQDSSNRKSLSRANTSASVRVDTDRRFSTRPRRQYRLEPFLQSARPHVAGPGFRTGPLTCFDLLDQRQSCAHDRDSASGVRQSLPPLVGRPLGAASVVRNSRSESPGRWARSGEEHLGHGAEGGPVGGFACEEVAQADDRRVGEFRAGTVDRAGLADLGQLGGGQFY